MSDEKVVYYVPEFLEVLKQQLESVSPETLHKIMNPMCGRCLIERGKRIIFNS